MATKKKLKVTELKVNPENPRTITEFMMGKLTESLLVFPMMLYVRPIIVNKDKVALGGNQRLQVLLNILNMEDVEIEESLENQGKYRMATEKYQAELKSFWSKWKKNPVTTVKIADDMTPEEEREFLVKDNLHYGENDAEILKKEFEREDIEDYVGSVPWNLYDYDNNKINDAEVDTMVARAKAFKCGYVEVPITDSEYEKLETALSDYCEQNFGSSEGFLSYLLGIPYKVDESNDNETKEVENED